MNKQEIKNRIKIMEEGLEELKKELNKKDDELWKPEIDEYYYSITSKNLKLTASEEVEFVNDFGDKNALNQYNYFKTEEETEEALQKVLVLLKADKLHKKIIGDWIFNINNTGDTIYHPQYFRSDKKIEAIPWNSYTTSEWSFPNEKLCRQFIEEMGNDIEILVLGRKI